MVEVSRVFRASSYVQIHMVHKIEIKMKSFFVLQNISKHEKNKIPFLDKKKVFVCTHLF